MTYAEQLHQERKQRLARFSSRAVEDTPIQCLSASERAAAARSFETRMLEAFPETASPAEPAELPEIEIAQVWPYLPSEFATDCSEADAHEPLQRLRPSVRQIQKVVASSYCTPFYEMLSPRRTANVVRPRQVAMYLAKKITLLSFPDIGRRFGGRDHTTVLHAVRKIGDLITTDPALAAEIDALKQQIEGCPA